MDVRRNHTTSKERAAVEKRKAGEDPMAGMVAHTRVPALGRQEEFETSLGLQQTISKKSSHTGALGCNY